MEVPPDNISNKSRSSGSSNGNNTDRRSSGSSRNANADNIQRAHQCGRRSISNANTSNKNAANSPLRAADGKRKSCSISPNASEPVAIITDQNGNDSREQPAEMAPRQRRVVKKQMRQVVGDLEAVIGELRTVMGDLKTLVNQIDVVTERLDRQYPEEGDAKRRLSASALESQCRSPAPAMRHSVSHSHNIQRTSAPPLLPDNCLTPLPKDRLPAARNGLLNHVIYGPLPRQEKPRASPEANKRDSYIQPQGSRQTSSKPPSTKTNSSSEKQSKSKKSVCSISRGSKSSNASSCNKSNHHSVPSTTKDSIPPEKEAPRSPLKVVEELTSPLDAKAILDALPRREMLIPPCFFAAIENNISCRVVKNKSRSPSTQSKGHKKTKSDTTAARFRPNCHPIWTDTFSDSWFDTADRSSLRSKCSSGGQTQPRSGSPPRRQSPDMEYCGVYERELDEKLELEFDDHLDIFETYDKDFDRPYRRGYDKNINTWKRYTMDYSSRDASYELSDDRLSDSVTETSSDILNDNFLPRTVNPNIVNYSWRTVIEP